MPKESPHTLQISDGPEVRALRRRPLRLTVVQGPDRGSSRTLADDHIVIGTHESCNLVLTDSTVSRQHLAIDLVPTGYRLRDLDSLNGTFVGGLRIGEVESTGDVRVRVGESELELRTDAKAVDIELPPRTRLGSLLGRSAAMRRIFDLIERVAPSPVTVLITGESGTGKEVTARTIHEHSPRADGPFVVVDCAALPPTLIESELYGHERGAFTGAEKNRKGAFELASGGTLFLDELGELPLELQTRLLGVLERRQVQPLGSSQPRSVDVRLVAATNRDLRREVNRGNFRSDLYFRLAVVTLEMPALRDRPEDIPLYVEAFTAEQARLGQSVSIRPETIEALMRRPWPGNVRELRNALERAAALGDVGSVGQTPAPVSDEPTGASSVGTARGDTVRVGTARVGTIIDPSVPFKTAKGLLIAEFEEAYVRALMNDHDGNITQAARSADIDRVYLLRLLDKFDLRPTKKKR